MSTPGQFPRNRMHVLAGACAAVVIGQSLSLLADDAPAWLRWRNGDELRGAILESEEDRILWKADPFAAPLRLGLDQLEGIRFSSSPPPETSPDLPGFRIFLKGGDRLEGSLQAIDAETVTVSCPPFAEPVSIRRTAIERIVHINSSFLQYAGPDDLGGWTSSGRDRKPTDWFTDLRGAFSTHQWSGNLFREIEFPEAVEISFSAAFPNGSPNLEIGLVRKADEGPMIETWDNYLVLTYRSRFVPVLEVTEDTKRIEFRLFWNQASGDLRLCDPSGRLLASLEGAVVEKSASSGARGKSNDPHARGFSILNRTPELRLRALTVQAWDGGSIPEIDLNRPRLLLAGKEPRFRIEDVTLASGSQRLRVGGNSLPLDRLQELIISPAGRDEEAGDPGKSTRIAWHGGSTVSGEFRQLGASALTLAPDWSETPVRVLLDHAKEIRFPAASEPLFRGDDRLEGDGFALHGTTRPLPQVGSPSLIGWQPPGAEAPVPFADGVEATVVRDRYPATKPELTGIMGQARVYLVNDEILVGSLISITEDKLHFTSRMTGQLAIPTTEVRAVDIGSAGRVLEGFGDSEWEEIESAEDEVVMDKNTVRIRGGSFGNPSLLLGDRIHFSAEWDQAYGAVTLRLFADGPSETSPSTDIIIAAQGNRLFVGRLKESGAFSFSGDQIPIVGNKANFEIRAQPEKVEVIVNGKSTLDLAVDPEKVSGNGLYFKMGGGWQGWNQSENEITLSRFRVERTPGSVPRRVIDPNARVNALTIPRNRRDPLPRHLLVAPNGDLLRGRLEAASGNNIRFTSDAATIDLPRNRVSAIVWLEEPDPDEGDGKKAEAAGRGDDFEVTHQFTLEDGSRLHLAADRIENNRFVGNSAVLGECSVSLDNIREMRRGPATPVRDLEKSGISAFSDWKLTLTPDPKIPGTESEPVSPLVGTKAAPFQLTLLDDTPFRLSDMRGRVVVLDFWATWCGPCIKAMPDVRAVMNAFPEGAVSFCAVNQGETLPIVEGFLEARKWTDLPVALDFDLKVSRNYEVDAIPHTVVVGKDGNIAWVHTGYSKDLKKQLFDAVAAALQAQ